MTPNPILLAYMMFNQRSCMRHKSLALLINKCLKINGDNLGGQTMFKLSDKIDAHK